MGCSTPEGDRDGPTTVDGLVGRMEAQDAASPLQKTTTAKDDDGDEFLGVEEVILAATDPSTRHGYDLANRRLILYLFKQDDATQKRLLHPRVIQALKSVQGGKKSKRKRESDIAMHLASAATKDFHPVKLDVFTEYDFVGFLLTLTDTKNLKFRLSYGDLRSALTYLYTRCEVVPTAQFKLRLKGAMKGLKNTAAKARG